MCFVRISGEGGTFFLPYTALTECFCVIEVESVYCAVRTEPLYKTDTLHLKKVKPKSVTYSALILCTEYGANKRECAPIAEHIITGTVQLKCQKGSQRVYNVTLRRVREIVVAVEKQKLVAYSECICVALVTQHVKHMSSIILFPSVACLALKCLFFHIISYTARFSKKKVIEH
jgi:hypothetical protein